jgi:GAF domain-containing protein
VLHDLAGQVPAVLDIDGAGVSVQDSGRLLLVTALDEGCAIAERAQENGQAGPCVDAWCSGQPATVTDLREASCGWGGYEQLARDAGIVALAGIPMRRRGESIGALDLYSTRPRDWTADDLDADPHPGRHGHQLLHQRLRTGSAAARQ